MENIGYNGIFSTSIFSKSLTYHKDSWASGTDITIDWYNDPVTLGNENFIDLCETCVKSFPPSSVFVFLNFINISSQKV